MRTGTRLAGRTGRMGRTTVRTEHDSAPRVGRPSGRFASLSPRYAGSVDLTRTMSVRSGCALLMTASGCGPVC
jgi:hypothetical protein